MTAVVRIRCARSVGRRWPHRVGFGLLGVAADDERRMPLTAGSQDFKARSLVTMAK